jgi:hypothetical protein
MSPPQQQTRQKRTQNPDVIPTCGKHRHRRLVVRAATLMRPWVEVVGQGSERVGNRSAQEEEEEVKEGEGVPFQPPSTATTTGGHQV